MTRRLNGEGSIYRHRNGYAAYAWVETPAGTRRRKYVYGPDQATVQRKWLDLKQRARRGPVATRMPTVASYIQGWLADVVRPNLAPKTAVNYEMMSRLYIGPGLGSKRLDKLSVRDVQQWFNALKTTCQCCAQGKDARREVPRCCAKGECCRQIPSDWTTHQAWTVLLAVLSSAVRDELVARNVASMIRVPVPRKKPTPVWSVDEARRFLESAERDQDPNYCAYVLLLILGLRKGDLLGLCWEDVGLEAGTVVIQHQLQRIEGELLPRGLKTPASEATLPLPDICVRALKAQRAQQDQWRLKAGEAWDDYGLVITTRLGSPVDGRNFHRAFKTRIRKAGVPETTVHATRKACASLLVALDVHPRVAMFILRHSKIAVTMEIYSQASSAATTEALKRLGEQFDERPVAS